MAQAQQEPRFAEVTPVMVAKRGSQIAISIQAEGVEANIHNGADPATVEKCAPHFEVMLNDFKCSCPVYMLFIFYPIHVLWIRAIAFSPRFNYNKTITR